ncbi:universal stress protein [Pontibacter sp. BT310]|uniref:Universal stress protein n=1 Tax=Pontibacter populi TaxID=890055 RepID=A0ABS6XDM5_9BACT|nr:MULTISPECIES: universal stress protein [Pontibacter]MBJ6118446.1 universal stress protein [Pontibacter sp. BT310]MBR0570874.1 universal stress protein [Microvirga sp. STS03]MBW3365300.1 universal stress protein [Pontibacter populi]
MKTFLVPVDFSENAVRALEYAIGLAAQADAEIVVLHALDTVPMLPGLQYSRATDDAAQKLLKLIDQVSQPNVQIKYMITDGKPVGDINKAIKDLHVTLVVMGTGGAKNFTRKMFGTTTEAIAKRGLCPVLAIPEGAEIKPIKNIVYAADLENGDQLTAMQLLQLKQLMNASLTFLHIKNGRQPDYIDNEYIKSELIKQYPEAEINFVELEHKDIAEGISNYVHEQGADLLSFTVLNRIFLEKILHSSVTSKLLQTLKLPMLALPENGELLDLQISDRVEMSSL